MVELQRCSLPLKSPSFKVERDGRCIYMGFAKPHNVISTCQSHGGQRADLEGICNHQSCEGGFHNQIASEPIQSKSEKERHRELADSMGWDGEKTAFMGTAANMQYAVLSKAKWEDLEVHVIATAGVAGNATCAGDVGKYHQKGDQWIPCEQPTGTINLMVHVSHPLSPAALSRSVVTLTEAKTAALMDLQIRSKSSTALATGTGTDQFAVASPTEGGDPLTWAGAHTKLGELIGKAVKDAVLGALEWQNGLDPKRCRNLFHLLGRFGFSEESWESWIKPKAGEERWDFFRSNKEAVVHDPGVSACASALASLFDQERKGHLPLSIIADQVRHFCALMVVQIGNSPDEFSKVLKKFEGTEESLDILAEAIVLAWEEKWS